MEIEGYTRFYNTGQDSATITKNNRLYFRKGLTEKLGLDRYNNAVIMYREGHDQKSSLSFLVKLLDSSAPGSIGLVHRGGATNMSIKTFLEHFGIEVEDAIKLKVTMGDKEVLYVEQL